MNPGLLDHDSALDHHRGLPGPNLFEFPYFRYLATKRAQLQQKAEPNFSGKIMRMIREFCSMTSQRLPRGSKLTENASEIPAAAN